MRGLLGISIAALFATTVFAQQETTGQGSGAIIRGLDRVNGQVSDATVPVGGQAAIGALKISVEECRYPEGNPSGEAYAKLRIEDDTNIAFEGWMIASSPALNALDHARYDVWVLRCTTS